MVELTNNKIIANLLIRDTSCIYFSCVLEGSMEGRVWVNSLDIPTFAVVWNEYQKGFQLMGEAVKRSEYKSLRVFFESVSYQMLKEKNINYFECGTDSDELTQMLFDVFKNVKIDSEQQKVFRVNHIICPKEVFDKVSRAYDIIAIDAPFLNKNYDNVEYVMKEIDSSWISREAYLKSGYGYAAVIDNHIVSRSLVTCSYKVQDNIGVDTLQDYRRQGISKVLVYMTLLEASKRKRQGVWDCMEENIASERTALKVGFELERTYTVSWFHLT